MRITSRRKYWFELAKKHSHGEIVDVGAGSGEFAKLFNKPIHELDGNKETVKQRGIIYYRIPKKLPFKKESIDTIHCSHIIEHVEYQELEDFIRECDRVLSPNGKLIISTPLLWSEFYGNLTHIKPYNPGVITRLLSWREERGSPTTEAISTAYKVVDLQYRYRMHPLEPKIGSRYKFIDKLILCTYRLLNLAGFKEFEKNGYTIILQKT